MPSTFVVLEVKPETSLSNIINFANKNCARFAIVNRVPGIFEPPTSFPAQNRVDFELKKENSDGKDVLVWREQRDPHRKISEILSDDELPPPKKKSRKSGDICGLCDITLNGSSHYRNTRLREHVQRHLNDFTAKCGHCDHKGILREHVRKHHSLKHSAEPVLIIPITLDDDYRERFAVTWDVCFPKIPLVALPLVREQQGARVQELLSETVKSIESLDDNFLDSHE